MLVPPLISSEQVASLVVDVLDVEVSRVTRLSGSVANQDFVIEHAGEPRLVLKAGPEAEIPAEAWASAQLASIGIPVPQVIVSELDPSELGSPFLIASFVAGEPTSDADVVRDVGAQFRRVHEEELPGWGPLIVKPETAESPGVGGRYSSWRDAIEADLAGLRGLVEAGVLEERVADAARMLVGVEGLLEYEGPGVLLHNDLKPAHLFGLASQGRQRLSAIIDWGDASIGDPAAEIARLSMSGPAVTAAFLDGYDTRLTAELADRRTRYRIVWNLRALNYELQAGGDWFDTYRSRINDDAARLLT
jgi:aminoglycoside phosphotransferase (APT) family kinase protein